MTSRVESAYAHNYMQIKCLRYRMDEAINLF